MLNKIRKISIINVHNNCMVILYRFNSLLFAFCDVEIYLLYHINAGVLIKYTKTYFKYKLIHFFHRKIIQNTVCGN